MRSAFAVLQQINGDAKKGEPESGEEIAQRSEVNEGSAPVPRVVPEETRNTTSTPSSENFRGELSPPPSAPFSSRVLHTTTDLKRLLELARKR